MTAPDNSPVPWSLSPAESVSRLGVDPDLGLAPEEAARRLAHVGHNRLTEPPMPPWWQALPAQFASPLNLVLVSAAILAGVVQRSYHEGVAIGLVLALNGMLGFVQDRRADRAVAALRDLVSPSARVRRDGVVVEVPATDLVPGDIVMIEAGDRVPADGRVLWQQNLEIDESGLTGESMPVASRANRCPVRLRCRTAPRSPT